MIDTGKVLDLNSREIEIPELGGKLFIRDLTILEAGKIANAIKGYPEDERNWWDIFHTIALAVHDEQGDQVFTAEQVSKIPRSKVGALIKLRDEILGNSGELEKNSETAPTGN